MAPALHAILSGNHISIHSLPILRPNHNNNNNMSTAWEEIQIPSTTTQSESAICSDGIRWIDLRLPISKGKKKSFKHRREITTGISLFPRHLYIGKGYPVMHPCTSRSHSSRSFIRPVREKGTNLQ
jgi:hypothetical protein